MCEEKRYYVYIMASLSLTLYTDVTGNIFYRALQHKAGETDGFSKKYHIKRLVCYETFKYVNNALAREKQVKAWNCRSFTSFGMTIPRVMKIVEIPHRLRSRPKPHNA
jgi:putative endonuclease